MRCRHPLPSLRRSKSRCCPLPACDRQPLSRARPVLLACLLATNPNNRQVNFGARGNGANEGEAGSGAGRGVKADPEGGDKRRRRARKDVYQLKKAIGRNVEKRKELEMALTKQEKSFAPVEERLVGLLAEVDAQSRAAKVANSVAEQVQARLAKAEHDVSMLEIQKLELEQAQVMQEGMMRERDLALQKVSQKDTITPSAPVAMLAPC